MFNRQASVKLSVSEPRQGIGILKQRKMKENSRITLLVLFSGVCRVMASACYSSLYRLNAKYGTTSYLRSSNYPFNYNPNQNCYWYIAAPFSSMVIKVTFIDFNLESSSTCSTFGDYVELRDGSSSSSTFINRYCGTKRPPVIISKGRYLYIKFHSDSTFQYKGFNLAFTAVYSVTQVSGKCSASYSFAANNNIQLTSEHSIITSPSYPLNYPNNMQCTWKITAPIGKIIKLTIDYMNIESTILCDNDYLQVRDGYFSTSYKKGDYCGSTRKTIYSSGRYLWLRFRSNHVYTYGGFKISYSVRESTGSSSVGVMVGVLVGVLVAIAVIVGIVVCVACFIKKKRSHGAVVRNTAPSVITNSTVTTSSYPAPVQGQYQQNGQLYPGPPPQGQPNPYSGPPTQEYPNSYPGPNTSGQPPPYTGLPLAGQPNSFPPQPPLGYPNSSLGHAQPHPYPADQGGPPSVSM